MGSAKQVSLRACIGLPNGLKWNEASQEKDQEKKLRQRHQDSFADREVKENR